MDTAERAANLQIIVWFFQTTQSNSLAVALAVSALSTQDEADGKWPYRPSKRYTIAKGLQDVWADEADGGINDELFEFYARFKKDEIRQLAYCLDIPTKFGVDNRSGYPLAATESPEEALLVFLWRSAHPLALDHLITVFGKSRTWLSRVYQGVLKHIWKIWGPRIEFDNKLMSKTMVDKYCAAIGNSLDADSEMIFGFIDGTE